MCDVQSIPVEMSNIPWELGSMAKSTGREEDVHLQAISSDVAAHVMRGIKFPKDCVKQFKEFEIKTEGGWYVFGSQRKQQEESRRGERCGWKMQSLSGRRNLGGGGRNADHARREEGSSQPALPSPLVTSPPHPRWPHPQWRQVSSLGDGDEGNSWPPLHTCRSLVLCTPVFSAPLDLWPLWSRLFSVI